MKDQYETCLMAKSGECSARERIAEMATERDHWKARAAELEYECRWRSASLAKAQESNIALIRRYVWDDGGNNIEAKRNAWKAKRNRWKARAKALERLVVDAYNDDLDLPCTACKHFPCDLDCGCPGYFKFSFNDAYFDATPETEETYAGNITHTQRNA